MLREQIGLCAYLGHAMGAAPQGFVLGVLGGFVGQGVAFAGSPCAGVPAVTVNKIDGYML